VRKQRIKELIAAFVVGNAVLDLIAPRRRATLWLPAMLWLFRSEGLRKLTLWFADHPTALRLRGVARGGIGVWLALRQYQEAPRPWYQRRFSEYRSAASWLAPVVLMTGILLTAIFYARRCRKAAVTQGNKYVFRRYVEEVGNEGNLDLVDEIFDRYVSHQPDGSTSERGPADVKRFLGELREAFPDYRSDIEDQIAEGDKVATRWRMHGTHQGEFRGLAPTGKQVNITGIGIFRFSGGKVVESWDNFDQLGLMRQLGAIPVR
jgi:steroid delta-isomerase-like uncharacterized protein